LQTRNLFPSFSLRLFTTALTAKSKAKKRKGKEQDPFWDQVPFTLKTIPSFHSEQLL